MVQPVVSVVIPVYNGEKVLQACVRSVLEQDAEGMELIIVDDGSTDGTWALLERLAAEDGRVRPIHQANGGVSSARNTALRHCRGEFIRFVDADDVLPPGSMRTLLEKARDNGSDLVIAGYTEVVGPMRTARCLRKCEDTMPCNDVLPHLNVWANSFYYGVLWNKLFRREIIEKYQVAFISGLNWGEDFAFVCRYLAGAEKVSFTQALVYDYQRNAGGMTVKQFFDCARHPFANCRMKGLLFQELKTLYIRRGVYSKYRWTLWLYLFRVTLSN
ncbi:MAG: glycosyltransferase family 2 protein [Clostridia bacterium]|nr:glycosyltransferase family 2 protein [Clostridia bacterium]